MTSLDQSQFEDALQLRDKGERADARQALERLLTERPNSAALLAVLGDVCWDLGDLPNAVIHFRKATTLSPASETASLGLFHTLWEAGQRHEALAEARRFLQLTDSEEYRDLLAEVEPVET